MPPKFGDLSKSVKDLLVNDKGKDKYGCGELKLKYKFKASNGVGVTFDAKKTDQVSFTNESTYTTASGIGLTEKFESSNKITLTAKAKDKFVKGLATTVEGVFLTSGGFDPKSMYTVKADYSTDGIMFDGKYNKGKLNSSFVYQLFGNWAVGATFENKGDIKPSNYALGLCYKDADMTANSKVSNNGNDIEASLFHTPSSAIDTGLIWKYDTAKNSNTINVGANYKLDDTASTKAMLFAGQTQSLSVGYTQQLRKEVELSMAAKVDILKLNGGDHSFGVGLVFSS
jgi:hypothetical protein